MGAEFTLGAEEELHLIDLDRWELSARAPQILSRLPSAFYSAEIQRTTVETNTAVVRTLADLRAELLRLRRNVIEVAAQERLGVAAVGTAPRSSYADFELTSTGRYSRMQEQYRLLVDEQLICGTQIHVGVSDRDVAVEIAQRIARDLPVLLALSASSPYWNGQDTGYASIRTIIWQRWPSAGSPGRLSSSAEYDQLVADLIGSGVIADAKMAYFDVRPSSHAPTLELRVCDACPLVDDAVLIAGLFRGLARAAELDIEAGRAYTAPLAPLHRAGIWQAARCRSVELPRASTVSVSSETVAQSPNSSSCGRSRATRSRTTSCAGRGRGGSEPSTSWRDRPLRAACQMPARCSGASGATYGRPASMSSSAARARARKRPAMSTASSTSGQASHTRSSSVGACADGRTSKYAILASAMTPELIRSATSWSYSAAEESRPGEPALGQRCQMIVRMLA